MAKDYFVTVRGGCFSGGVYVRFIDPDFPGDDGIGGAPAATFQPRSEKGRWIYGFVMRYFRNPA
jgi:hypothetical protein